ncbi:3-oxoacyl-ACP synthase [Verminephrobacter aporrectodeae subsp. tuberculatae]|uniref:beta-ketoacyl synthase chain length factor n=1 Tax=Verminephrobacter aporrectodeae TaxID=1110389 RepID=UPI0022374311|nr:beta-ketoacyl synthase chain length factor [Verminephrobacter aporrectodeae]MCW5255976.1 3-oxoacyl-ACP synthase [Verminephrobacter aporrectodeae subsp. tuberculatae]
MPFELTILEWSAYADGLSQRADWLQWAAGSAPLPRSIADTVPALAEMPAMMRRRVNRLGRLACQVAYWCPPAAGAPMVFASRYGDADRSLALLGDLVQGQPVSPTGFGLSVHNAISALYSIAQGHCANTVVVAAGRASAAAALTEAAALLADGAAEVLVVYYEAPLPRIYAEFEDQPGCEYAWAWRVALPRHGDPEAPTVRLSADEIKSVTDTTAELWPTGLAMLHYALRKFASMRCSAP